MPEKAKQEVLNGNDNIRQDDARVITQFDKPTQKQFIKEVEKGTPIKEAVKKVDPKQKTNPYRV